jgi:putative ABC transport system permease protein
MTALLTILLGRLPIGWLQLTHKRSRFLAAVTGVAFANLLVFFQLGFLSALGTSVVKPYAAITADIILSGPDSRTLAGGKSIPRQRVLDAMSLPGVAAATALYVGQMPIEMLGEPKVTLTIFGVDPSSMTQFWRPDAAAHAERIEIRDTAVIDSRTRMLSAALMQRIEQGLPELIEFSQRQLAFAGIFAIGAGFESDGYVIVSDLTFLRLFPQRFEGAPTHVLIRLLPGAQPTTVITALQVMVPIKEAKIQSFADAATAERMFQTVERPIGVIFGFGAMMGLIVGLVIVYQVLSTDVADHLQEYATFKAMGYRDRFFLGIILEEAVILAICGFVPGSLVSIMIYKALAGATGLPLEMSTARLVSVFVGTVLACIISGALATRRLAAADPAELF